MDKIWCYSRVFLSVSSGVLEKWDQKPRLIPERLPPLFYCLTGKAITKDDLFEGDILLTDSTRPIVEAVNGNVSYDAVMSDAYKWPNALVPYVFDPNFGENLFKFKR